MIPIGNSPTFMLRYGVWGECERGVRDSTHWQLAPHSSCVVGFVVWRICGRGVRACTHQQLTNGYPAHSGAWVEIQLDAMLLRIRDCRLPLPPRRKLGFHPIKTGLLVKLGFSNFLDIRSYGRKPCLPCPSSSLSCAEPGLYEETMSCWPCIDNKCSQILWAQRICLPCPSFFAVLCRAWMT